MEREGSRTERLQLHRVLSYKFEPREDPFLRRYLERGYRIEQLQRISDREAVITLRRDPAAD